MTRRRISVRRYSLKVSPVAHRSIKRYPKMNESRVEGAVHNVAGKVEAAIGGVTDDIRRQVEGKTRQGAGKVKGTYSDAAEQTSDLAAAVSQRVGRQPLTALLIAGVVGCMLGWFMRRR
jgi:uncharacterized protein YjbJ (UPF0337 family)